MSPVLSGLVGGALLALLSWFIVRTSRRPQRVGNRSVLLYGTVPRVFVLALGAALPILVIHAYFQGRAGTDVIAFTLVLDALFLGYMVPELFLTRIEFDDDNIYTFSAWRKPRVIPWSSITGTSYSAFMYWHTLTTSGFGSVRVHDWLEGASNLLDFYNRRRVAS